MGIAHYIRVIGRGARGARSLDREQAHDLMSQLLDGQLSDLEVGAFALAMRIKGESLEELRGFHAAVQARLAFTTAATRPPVLLPSYNGARKRPNLTPLLAGLLTREGVPALVHGRLADSTRVGTSAALFRRLGWPVASDAAEVASAWSRREPVYLPLEALHPPLARLLAVRDAVGVRNSGHTLAKLLDPVAPGAALRVVNYTHAEYATLLGEFLAADNASAMLLRGSEGEPYADPRRFSALEVYVAGERHDGLSCPAEERAGDWAAMLPGDGDVEASARYTERALAGDAEVPAPLTRQVSALVAALGALPPVAAVR